MKSSKGFQEDGMGGGGQNPIPNLIKLISAKIGVRGSERRK
jgi:hypothetical protein